ncbi:hypothetical protein GUITHDRAFT_138644 [Guillardia theta CCMP2712]|uniref:Uncharacterized protein n=1 Tax=Guillardia theta (strain CCMP2712) TaxID=905079 RepID=L1JCH8_GUITC|nr:hypothetical protein GUITHDRAFT_138644 [Guillardia theta CCMP2712]EKX45775.1 hypothetical protein GUITHDRAFT_138644 [Guillardia theta CCMP2712]|eukprot:XP_005832755.1 hypothetical protein GUITHDRAFT_138644 [Guillardia theta CCMP2712]
MHQGEDAAASDVVKAEPDTGSPSAAAPASSLPDASTPIDPYAILSEILAEGEEVAPLQKPPAVTTTYQSQKEKKFLKTKHKQLQKSVKQLGSRLTQAKQELKKAKMEIAFLEAKRRSLLANGK